MELINHLKWRYATKAYNDKKVADDKVNQILEAINLSASSGGLQPYRVFVVTNPELRSELAKGSFNAQIEHSSHLLVFASLVDVSNSYIQEYLEMMEERRNMPKGALNDYKNSLFNLFEQKSPEEKMVWSSKQAYIGLGTAMIAAAELKVDATPMEGFNPEQFDELLGLKKQGLHSTVILTLGYRDAENDFLVNAEKVRLPLEEFSTFID